jgi:hypothetical protein
VCWPETPRRPPSLDRQRQLVDKATFGGIFCLRKKDHIMTFHLGQQVRLSRPLDYTDGGAAAAVDIHLPQGAVGMVADLGDDLNPIVVVQFVDRMYACLNKSDNCVAFDQDSDGGQGVGVAADFLTA